MSQLSNSGRLRIELVEDPTAPEHRRWSGRIELPDGTAGEIVLPEWEELDAATRSGIVEGTCSAPGCAEPCAAADRCTGCGALICPLCDLLASNPDSVESHGPHAHWMPDLAIATSTRDPIVADALLDTAIERLIMDRYPNQHRLTAELLARAHHHLPDTLAPLADPIQALRHAVLQLAEDAGNELAHRQKQAAWRALQDARGRG